MEVEQCLYRSQETRGTGDDTPVSFCIPSLIGSRDYVIRLPWVSGPADQQRRKLAVVIKDEGRSGMFARRNTPPNPNRRANLVRGFSVEPFSMRCHDCLLRVLAYELERRGAAAARKDDFDRRDRLRLKSGRLPWYWDGGTHSGPPAMPQEGCVMISP